MYPIYNLVTATIDITIGCDVKPMSDATKTIDLKWHVQEATHSTPFPYTMRKQVNLADVFMFTDICTTPIKECKFMN